VDSLRGVVRFELNGWVCARASPINFTLEPTFFSIQKRDLFNHDERVRNHRKQILALGLVQIKMVSPPVIISTPPGIGVTIDIIPTIRVRMANNFAMKLITVAQQFLKVCNP